MSRLAAIIRQIDQEAIKRDVFDTMKGRPTRLIGLPQAERGKP